MICAGCRQDGPTGVRCACGALLCPACSVVHVCAGGLAPLWPHQARGVRETLEAVRGGCKAVAVTSPTGGGKGRMISELARTFAAEGNRVLLYTNRRLLTGQATQSLTQTGLEHGVMAAGYGPELYRRVQVAIVQTVLARVASGKWELPPADVILPDEAHSTAFDGLLVKHREKGAAIVGFTATPVGLARKVGVGGHKVPLYDRLVVAGTNSELRRCGALVRCDVFAPSEPDMKGVKRNKVGEYVHEGMVRRVMQCVVFGDVFEHWKRLNPFGEPTLVFAPGVPESKWFAEEFGKRGVRAGHIDGDTPDDERQQLFAANEAGDVPVLCSYGVLREGVDLPHIRHGILIQACGALSTYLQIVGRLLRAAPGKDLAILQDHAGAWHRHGSPNLDRQWNLDDTDKKLARERLKKLQYGKEREPVCCPQCQGVRSAGPKCPHCGHEHQRSVRRVYMTDGTLKKCVGNAVKRKREVSADQKVWNACLYAAAYRKRSLSAAAGDFFRRTGYAVPFTLENVPEKDSADWGREAGNVYPFLVRRQKAKGGVG